MFKRAGHLLRPCAFIEAGLRGVRLTWLFFLILTKSGYPRRKPDKKFTNAGGERQVWYLHWNEAIVWNEMKLVPGFSGWACVLGKVGASEMELGAELE